MRLRTKFITFFILLFCIPLIIGLVVYITAHKQLIDLYDREFKTAFNMTMHFIDQKKAQVEATAMYLGRESRIALAVKNNTIANIRTNITEKLKVTSRLGVTYIGVFDREGNVLAQSDTADIFIDPQDMIAAWQGVPISEFTALEKNLYIISYAPLIFRDTLIGTVVCAAPIDTSFYTKIKDVTGLVTSAYVNGMFIPQDIGSDEMDFHKLAQNVVQSGAMKTATVRVSGMTNTLICVPLVNNHNAPFAALCIQMPMKSMLQLDSCFTFGMMFFFGAFFVLLIIFFVIANKYVVTPVTQLEYAAIRVAQGDFDVTLPKGHNDELGQLTRSFGSMISNLNNAQKELRTTNEQLADSNKQLEMYILTISHDLKSPIIVMQNFLHMLIDTLSDKKLEDDQQMFLDRMEKNLKKMLVIIKDITDYFKLGKLNYELKPTYFQDIVDESLQRLDDVITEKNAKIITALSFPEVLADKERCVTVLVNLLSNALRFSKDSQPPKIEIFYEEEQSCYRFFVQDNGIGIDPAYKDKIFDMFYTLKEVDVEHSSGVGLSMVKKIIEDHGGSIGVESQKGVGSTFYFTLEKAMPPSTDE